MVPPENVRKPRKPEVFWRFQGISKWNIGLRKINFVDWNQYFYGNFYRFWWILLLGDVIIELEKVVVA